VRLLHRTTRSVSLTDAGLRLLERLRPGDRADFRRSRYLASAAAAPRSAACGFTHPTLRQPW